MDIESTQSLIDPVIGIFMVGLIFTYIAVQFFGKKRPILVAYLIYGFVVFAAILALIVGIQTYAESPYYKSTGFFSSLLAIILVRYAYTGVQALRDRPTTKE